MDGDFLKDGIGERKRTTVLQNKRFLLRLPHILKYLFFKKAVFS